MFSLLVFPLNAYSQNSLSFGMSFGNKGYSFEFSYEKKDTNNTGSNYLLSIYESPYGNALEGDDRYFSWLVPTEQKETIGCFGLGYRYVYDKYGIGGVLDISRIVKYQLYVSNVTGFKYYQVLNTSTSIGISANMFYDFSENVRGSIYIGTTRNVLLGIEIVLPIGYY